MDHLSSSDILKVDDELGLVFGFAIVCKEADGSDYFDVQGDHIPEHSMLEAALDFAENSRIGKEMHCGEQCAGIVFMFPLTTEIAKAFDITTKRTGLMICYKPGTPELLGKFKRNEYRGFSIGGKRLVDEAVADG